MEEARDLWWRCQLDEGGNSMIAKHISVKYKIPELSVSSVVKTISAFLILALSISSCAKQPAFSGKISPRAVDGVIDLTLWDFEKDGPVQLNGGWMFYWKQLLKSADLKENQGHEIITTPGEWDDLVVNGQRIGAGGFATYRLKVLLPEALPNQLGLRIPSLAVQSAYELEINGKIINQIGKVGRDVTDSLLAKNHCIIPLPLNSNLFDIVLRVSNYHYSEGGLINPVTVGPLVRLQQEELDQANISWLLIGILGIIGFYHLGLFFIRRKDTSPLWFGIFSLILALRSTLVGAAYIYNITPADIQWLILKIDYLSFYLAIPFFVLYINRLFPVEFRTIILRLIIVISILFSLFVVIAPPILYTRSLLGFEIFTFISGLYTIFVIIFAVIRKREGSVLFLTALVLFFATFVNDVLTTHHVLNTGVYLFEGFIAFIFLQSYLLSRKFSNAFTTVEKQSLELTRLANVKDEFLANLSHELRTPLTAIYAYGEMFEHNDDPADMKEYGREIYSNSEKLISYIDDLMLLTRMESDIDMSSSETDIKEIIAENIDKLSKLANEKNISILNLAGSVPEIQANKKYLSKAIHAIIKNAVVYNKENGTVVIAAQNDNNMMKINVTDTGIGIAAGHLPLIFDRFYRVDSSDTYEVSGVGVGLFLAQKIIEMHGGTIGVKSELGRGSEFMVELPVK